MKAKCIMVQGTASSVGKSIVTAGLCRIFHQDGYNVAPFKSQNMALNSYITSEGGEMGRAQVVQAEAAGTEPSVLMNPILIKPVADSAAQVVINGKVYGNLTAMEYHELKPKLADMIRGIWTELTGRYEMIVIEGAGSPAEINLRENDLVNMGMAEIADAPVILVGDIDKGGVFAAIAGTMLLLTEKERVRVKGIIINKFRGDFEILRPGIKMLEEIVNIPVLGVLPYVSLNLEEEDGFLADKFRNAGEQQDKLIDIAVIKYPYMANDSDFNMLENVSDVRVRYVDRTAALGRPDMIILPGSKSTVSDLMYIRSIGLEGEIKELGRKGVPLFGICGGYQMLGNMIYDPEHIESGLTEIEGMGLLNINTVFKESKTTTQVEAVVTNCTGLFAGFDGISVTGYEIHMGSTNYDPGCSHFLKIKNVTANEADLPEGAYNSNGTVFGTYIHGIFDNASFTIGMINNLCRAKGQPELDSRMKEYRDFKEAEYDRFADIMRKNLDIKKIYEIIDDIT